MVPDNFNSVETNFRNCNCGCSGNTTSGVSSTNILSSNSNNSCGCSESSQMSREEMASMIKGYDFALTELGLYLDTHPNDNKALCLFRKYANISKNLKDAYQKVYGPLTQDFPCNKWRWLEEPWPWERGNF